MTTWKALVWEAWVVTFRGGLVENACFGSVSWKMLVLEAWIPTFAESLVEDACLGSLDFHFW